MILPKKSEEVVRLLPERHVLPIRVYEKIQKNEKEAYPNELTDNNPALRSSLLVCNEMGKQV